MEHPIVEKIMKEGINSVNLSMLDDESRKKILIDVSEKLYRKGDFIDAIKVITMTNDIEKLEKLGDLFISENRIELATLCFIQTKDKQKLNNAALLCIQSKNYKLAAKAYEAADNKQMSSFIQQNFVEE